MADRTGMPSEGGYARVLSEPAGSPAMATDRHIVPEPTPAAADPARTSFGRAS